MVTWGFALPSTQFAWIVLRELNRALLTGQIGFFLRLGHFNYPVEWLDNLIDDLEPGNIIHWQFGKLVFTHSQRRWDTAYRRRFLTRLQQNGYHFTNRIYMNLLLLAISLIGKMRMKGFFQSWAGDNLQLNLEKHESWRE